MSRRKKSLYVTVARLLRPRGNRGELVAENLSGRDFESDSTAAKNFFTNSEAILLNADGQRKKVTLEGAWLHRGKLVIKVMGVDSISAAEALRNLSVQISRDQLGPVPGGGYYFEDLIGCEVHNIKDGRIIGLVEDVLEPGGSLLLQVDAKGNEILIPFVKDICLDVEPEKKSIRVHMPDGLERLNL